VQDALGRGAVETAHRLDAHFEHIGGGRSQRFTRLDDQGFHL